jgi:hypothetical protein
VAGAGPEPRNVGCPTRVIAAAPTLRTYMVGPESPVCVRPRGGVSLPGPPPLGSGPFPISEAAQSRDGCALMHQRAGRLEWLNARSADSSASWHDFRAKLDRLRPRKSKPTQLSFEYDGEEEDTGKGL